MVMPRRWDLTAHQLEVLYRMAHGQDQKKIARGMGVTRNAVTASMTIVRRKLGAQTTPQAVLIAERRGLFVRFEQDQGVRGEQANAA